VSTSDEQEIDQLLKKGLDHYGVGEVSEAMQAWEQALALDPNNEQASDYVDNADRRRKPAALEDGATAGSFHDLVSHGQRLVAGNNLEGALQLFSRAESADVAALELGATVDLVRSCLLREYREEIGGRDAQPALRADSEALEQINLPADAGFMLSLVDGLTKLEDLVSLSGMDKFDAVRILRSLWRAGLVENRA
jgi:tetratricopeptide (TPR) repeat protein